MSCVALIQADIRTAAVELKGGHVQELRYKQSGRTKTNAKTAQ
jgi:hypothetical protein